MMRYKKISINEYNWLGKINVFASYPRNDYAIDILQKLTKTKINVVVFGLQKKLDLENNENISIDDTGRTDINYIERICDKILQERQLNVIIINSDKIDYTEDELWQLKTLGIQQHTPIIISTKLLPSAKNKKYPILDDLGNTDLEKRSDVIFLQNYNKSNKCVLAKNIFGKVGIIADAPISSQCHF